MMQRIYKMSREEVQWACCEYIAKRAYHPSDRNPSTLKARLITGDTELAAAVESGKDAQECFGWPNCKHKDGCPTPQGPGRL